MSIKISELNEIEDIKDEYVLPIVNTDANGTYKIEAVNLIENIVENMTAEITLESGIKISNGYEVTLPLYYIVGNNSLELYYNGMLLIAKTDSNDDGHYIEVGTAGEKSNQIEFYRTEDDGDYTLSGNAVVKVIVRNVHQDIQNDDSDNEENSEEQEDD